MMMIVRTLVCAVLLLLLPRPLASQATSQPASVLHIRIVLLDADQKATPVPRHALLISDNPASAAPRRVVTALDGSVDVKLNPGNYTVESDRPVTFLGKAYQWTQLVDVASGRDAVLDLTAANADVEAATPATLTPSAGPPADDPSFLLPQWQDSVVALWTPEAHASGFLIDATGLIATNQRVIGTATAVEVQISAAIKVAAVVVAADAGRDVAILRIDPQVVAALRPVPLGCGQASRPPVVAGQAIFTIGTPLLEPKGMASGTVSRADAQGILSDLLLPRGSAGGPVFTSGGGVVGITSLVDGQDDRRGDARVVPIDEACGVLAAAEQKIKDAAPPSAARLPIEPGRPFPVEALKEAAQRRAGSVSPYQMSSSDFDIAFITPVLTYGAQYQAAQVSGRERRRGAPADAEQARVRPLLDFGEWSEYLADFPPVLLIRVTPRLVEGFWTTVARGAARTQGVALPPIKHFKSGFARLRAFCGDTEVPPIHPFRLAQRVSGNDAIHEGLYVFDPGALTPQCGSVKLVLYSEKEPGKADTRVVEPGVLQQIWQDFAPYRAS